MRKRLVWFVVLIAAVGLLATGSVASAKQTTVTLTARLSGAQEVPTPADPDGSGKVKVHIDVAGGEVCFDVKLSDTGTPNRGHIHEAPAGENGDIVVTFFELRIPPAIPGAPATDPRNDALENGRLQDCVPGDPEVLERIVAESGRLLRERSQRALPCRLHALPARDVAHAVTVSSVATRRGPSAEVEGPRLLLFGTRARRLGESAVTLGRPARGELRRGRRPDQAAARRRRSEAVQEQGEVAPSELAGPPLVAEPDRRDLLEDQRQVVDLDVGAQPTLGLRPLGRSASLSSAARTRTSRHQVLASA